MLKSSNFGIFERSRRGRLIVEDETDFDETSETGSNERVAECLVNGRGEFEVLSVIRHCLPGHSLHSRELRVSSTLRERDRRVLTMIKAGTTLRFPPQLNHIPKAPPHHHNTPNETCCMSLCDHPLFSPKKLCSVNCSKRVISNQFEERNVSRVMRTDGIDDSPDSDDRRIEELLRELVLLQEACAY